MEWGSSRQLSLTLHVTLIVITIRHMGMIQAQGHTEQNMAHDS